MKRFLALLALALVLLAGTAGMASADTLNFDVGAPDQLPAYPYIPPSGSPIVNVDNINWHDEGGGHLYCDFPYADSVIRFTTPTRVNSFEMNGLPWDTNDTYIFGPLNIEAFNAGGGSLWTTTVNLAGYIDWATWLMVDVNTDNISNITFKAHGPGGYDGGINFSPSIDNLVINVPAAVPIPGSVWLLACGLLRLVGLRRKFTR